jgi:hydroxymethylpyrimidine/phosphomethylpyrimidine kinase
VILPTELATMTRIKLKLPCATRNPANGITNSEGTGTTMLSSIIRKNIPAYPRRDTVESAKPPIAARISDSIDMSRGRKSTGPIYIWFSNRSYKF